MHPRLQSFSDAEVDHAQPPGDTCPLCKGVSEHPEIEGCNGCMGCDWSGTREGFEAMKALDELAKAAPLPERDTIGE